LTVRAEVVTFQQPSSPRITLQDGWDHMRMNAALPGTLVLGLLLAVACGGSAPRAADPAMPEPTLSIEQFLRAANQNDLDTMASLFGTRDGSVTRVWSREEIDQRMFLLASVLRHSDYTIGTPQIVPGRREEATQYTVRMVIEGDTVNVPFLLVRSPRARHWMIEKVDIEAVTRRSGRR
jgi:hypothetical protein